ncbi:MAG: preprotein translocase subunit SecY [Minisyncoccia bacterium]
MFKKLLTLFRLKELRKKVLTILLLLFVFRVMVSIPLPGVDQVKLQQFFKQNQIFGLFNIFTGGAMSNISIAFLGIGPYITSSIIFQLLTMVFPSLKQMLQEGTEKERAQFEQYSRIFTVPLALLQGFAMLNLLKSQGIVIIQTPFDLLRNILVVVASTLILMWIGELITEQKMGNGISLIIFAGIVINLPRELLVTFMNFSLTKLPNLIIFLSVAFLIIVGVVFVSRGERRIPVNYAKQVRGTKIYGGAATYLPMKVNQAGVIPIIFALSILMFPQLIGQFLSTSKNVYLLKVALFLQGFNTQSPLYLILYFIFVFLFTFFYTSVTFEPQSIADNLQKRGGFIPGYRPGQATANYLASLSSRVTFFGALFLGLIAVLPILLEKASGITTLAIGGTSLLIMVEVAIETMHAIEAQLIMREYENI